MSDAILRVEHLMMRFGGIKALNDVNLEVERGSITALIGPNGAGKSTLASLLPRLYDVVGPNVVVHDVEGLPLIGLPTAKPFPFAGRIKRTIDIVGALVGLALAAPVFALAAWRIRRESPGPILFRQTRLGRDLREFTLLKFRTMRADVDDAPHRKYIRDTMSATAEVGSNGLYKLDRDDAVLLAEAREPALAAEDEAVAAGAGTEGIGRERLAPGVEDRAVRGGDADHRRQHGERAVFDGTCPDGCGSSVVVDVGARSHLGDVRNLVRAPRSRCRSPTNDSWLETSAVKCAQDFS